VLHSELSSFNIPKIQELVVRRPSGRHFTVLEPLPFIIITAEQVELVIGMEASFPVLPILYCVARTLRYPKNKGIFLCNFVPNSRLIKICRVESIVLSIKHFGSRAC